MKNISDSIKEIFQRYSIIIDEEFDDNHLLARESLFNNLGAKSIYQLHKDIYEDDIFNFYNSHCEYSEYLLIIDTIVYNNIDGYINTLAYTNNPSHIRFYTVQEILTLAYENYELLAFESIKKPIKFDRWARLNNKTELLYQLNSLPNDIKNIISITYNEDSSIDTFLLNNGVFLFKRL